MSTVLLPLNQLTPDMIAAENVYNFSNQLIIQAGTQLTDKIISRLKFYSITMIRIKEEEEEEPVIESDSQATKEVYHDQIRESESFQKWNKILLEVTDKIKDSFSNLTEKNVIDPYDLYDEVQSIINVSRNNINLLDMLHCTREYDDSIYNHSINVALISHILGKWLKFTKKDLETVTLCGLLHDIGKIMIPKEILNKPSSLTETEYDIVKTHTMKGYNLLLPLDINIHIKMTAMMHHERMDGSGYPMSIKESQIDRFAKVVMIADVYDAMTSARVYRKPLCPFEAISFIASEGLTKFDPKYIMTFFEHINQVYENSMVRLSDGSTGQIILINKNNYSRPVIKVGEQFIDLMQNQDLFIKEVL